MEVSCSGRCLDADAHSFAGRICSRKGVAAPSNHLPARPHIADQLHASLPAASRSRAPISQNRSSSQHLNRQTRCAAAPAVEVVTLGKVADVEEIEGLRVVMNEYKRPMVEYLIKWKVCMSSADLSAPCLISNGCTIFLTVLLIMSDMHVNVCAGWQPTNLVRFCPFPCQRSWSCPHACDECVISTALQITASAETCISAGNLDKTCQRICCGTLSRVGGLHVERRVLPAASPGCSWHGKHLRNGIYSLQAAVGMHP